MKSRFPATKASSPFLSEGFAGKTELTRPAVASTVAQQLSDVRDRGTTVCPFFPCDLGTGDLFSRKDRESACERGSRSGLCPARPGRSRQYQLYRLAVLWDLRTTGETTHTAAVRAGTGPSICHWRRRTSEDTHACRNCLHVCLCLRAQSVLVLEMRTRK